MAGTLWIVATPIGTLADLAPRAREVLAEVDLVVAEDTRRTLKLLSWAGVPVTGRLSSLHDHSAPQRVPELVAALHEGRSVALVSDAGTPVLADPGFELVRRVREEGLAVASVPGPSAFTAALAASGQPPLPAVLVGYLPPRQSARRRRIDELAGVPWTLVLLLSPHRLGRELADLAHGLGEGRPATLLAELSKAHERARSATLAELARGAEAAAPRGEYALVVGPPAQVAVPAPEPEQVRRVFERESAREGADRRVAIRATARRLGISRRRVYRLLLVEDGDADGEDGGG